MINFILTSLSNWQNLVMSTLIVCDQKLSSSQKCIIHPYINIEDNQKYWNIDLKGLGYPVQQ